MKTMMLSILALLAWLIAPPQQSPGVILVENELHPVPSLYQYDAVVWLENNRPAATHIYAVMDYTMNEHGEFISLAGLDPQTPAPYEWALEDGNVIWVWTIVRVAGEIELYQPGAIRAEVFPVATMLVSPLLQFLPAGQNGPGGGTNIYLPWQAGKQMMFGDRGVHGGGFGVSGAIGIDWVSGDDLGTSAASSVVYASASGTVTTVCTDDYSKSILVGGGSDTIGYLHLDLGTSLDVGDTVSRGQSLGRLVYGSFNDTCGWASQQPDHYHLHWIIIPAAGKYQAEGWTLNVGAEEWKRGNESIKKRQWLTGGGGYGSYDNGEDDPTAPGPIIITPGDPGNSGGGGARLWDYVVLALNGMYGTFKDYYIPDGSLVNDENEQMWLLATNMMRTMIQDWNIILVNDVINLFPWFTVAGMILGAEIIRWVAIIGITVFMALGMVRGAFKWW